MRAAGFGGWRLAGVPVPSVQFNRSILSVQAVVPGERRRLAAGVGWRRAIVQGARWLAVVLASGGGRSWALTRGQFCDCTIHETAKTVPNTQNSSSSSTKTPILCSKCLKMGVPKAKSAQKPRFCARNARKRGFRSQKKHKNPDFVLGKKGIGSGKRRYWHREAQPLPSCKSPRTLPKCKYLITK